MAKTVFYCRVSTKDQRVDSQVAAARKLGVKDAHIFIEKASGVRHDRPELAKALATLEPGDTLACFKLDRIGRSLAHLTKLLHDLESRNVHFRTVEDGLSTQGSTGKLILHILGSVAQFERDLILDRIRAGLAAARERNAVFGRRRKMAPQHVAQARAMLAKGDGDLNAETVAGKFNVSRRTLFRNLREQRDRETLKGEAAE